MAAVTLSFVVRFRRNCSILRACWYWRGEIPKKPPEQSLRMEGPQAHEPAQPVELHRVVQMLLDVVACLRQHVRLGMHLSGRAALAGPVTSAFSELAGSKELY